MKFQIVCDSSADLPENLVAQHRITVVPYYVTLDGEHSLKEGVELSVPDFYKSILDNPNCFPSSSMPSLQDYMDAFRPFAEQKIPLLCICLTKAFSGSMQCAVNARNALLEDFPDAQIHVMDSMSITGLQSLFVLEAVRLRDLDMSLEDAIPLLEGIRTTGRIVFTTKDLKYLEHGGRVSKAARVAGSMLDLKPILTFSNGDVEVTEICRGRKHSLQKVIRLFVDYVEKNHLDLNDYAMASGIGAMIPEYQEFQDDLKEAFRQIGQQPADWLQTQIGATVGVHTGPYPMGMCILKKVKL